MGDSPGGDLTLALTRYLIGHQHSKVERMPAPPEALVLASPLCNLRDLHETPESAAGRFDYIYVTKGYTYHLEVSLGPHGFEAAAKNKYISPACKSLAVDFKGFPRTFIIAEGAEMLLDEIKALGARMSKDLGEGDGLSKR